jgi:hypothetical protein
MRAVSKRDILVAAADHLKEEAAMVRTIDPRLYRSRLVKKVLVVCWAALLTPGVLSCIGQSTSAPSVREPVAPKQSTVETKDLAVAPAWQSGDPVRVMPDLPPPKPSPSAPHRSKKHQPAKSKSKQAAPLSEHDGSGQTDR